MKKMDNANVPLKVLYSSQLQKGQSLLKYSSQNEFNNLINSNKETIKDADVPRKPLVVPQLVLFGTLLLVHVDVINSHSSAKLMAMMFAF